MVALLDLQDELKISCEEMDCLIEYLDIFTRNDMVFPEDARAIADAYLDGTLDEIEKENIQIY